MKNRFSFLNTILVVFILLTIMIIIYQYNHPEIKVIANEPKQDNNLISMLVEQEDGTYKESKENVWNNDKYIFNEELSGCENGGQLSFDGEKVKVTTNKSDKCYVYFDYVKLNDYLIKLHTGEGANQIYYHDGQGEYPNSNLEAGDLSYRYSGSSAEVENYVCLDGTTTTGTCSSDEDLYRIIGLFPNENSEYEAKLIKAMEGTTKELGDNTTAVGGSYNANFNYRWNSTHGNSSSDINNNMWQYSNLNKINLNTFYLNYLTNKVANLDNHITSHNWTTGGFSFSNTHNTKEVYNKELGDDKLSIGDVYCYAENNNTTKISCQEDDLNYLAKIGLMYVSDYGYAAYPNAWNIFVGKGGYTQENITTNNWLFLGIFEYAISRETSGTGYSVWNVTETGYAGTPQLYSDFAIRPVFYLSTNTKIISGDGSKTNPYRFYWVKTTNIA